jgi:hypothetical protein
MDEAGKTDTCPDCRAQFVVPGVEQRERIQKEEAIAKRRKQEQVERALREKQLRDAAEREQVAARRQPNEVVQQIVFTEPPATSQRFEYHMVQIPPTIVVDHARGNEAALYLQRVVNEQAQRGWEFYRVNAFTVKQRPGCLLGLFSGVETSNFIYHVVTFRRPVNHK